MVYRASGLAEGDLVVTHGAFKIDAELQIRGRPSMMQPEGGRPRPTTTATLATQRRHPPATPART
jgi:hypothetical protein